MRHILKYPVNQINYFELAGSAQNERVDMSLNRINADSTQLVHIL